MTVSAKRREYRNRRGTREATVEEFDAYTAAFAEDVAAKRASMADACEDADDLAAEFSAAGEAFDDAVRAFAEEIAARRAAIATADDGVEAYARTFAADLESKRSAASTVAESFAADAERLREEVAAMGESEPLRDDIEALAAAFESAREEFAAAAESFDADGTRFREATAATREAIDDERAAFEHYVDEFYGEAFEAVPARKAETETPSNGGGDEPSASDDTAVPTRAESSDETGGADRSPTAVEDDSDASASAPEPAEFSEGGPDATDDGDDGDEASNAAFENRLRRLQYGKLKQAANRVGYEGNLNAAKKDELVAFLVQHRAELEEALTDEDADA